jgi:hypothetical protein
MKTRRSRAPAIPVTYQIKVQGSVDPHWSDWFNGLNLTLELDGEETPFTTLTGRVPDQAALRGVLNKLWDMNLTLISVTQIAAAPEREVQHDH